ncbi:hypothetical protein PoMZ_05975 [Pyricularia oryzae]|uniref:Uncharacterized protein n=1 Tax=Pyricularia oryzae TaxID=318829 RepID=A0A4P7NPW7_PYROR|nr:hypothetical protein PoMZ_05975 [Pyricularia oryzae]
MVACISELPAVTGANRWNIEKMLKMVHLFCSLSVHVVQTQFMEARKRHMECCSRGALRRALGPLLYSLCDGPFDEFKLFGFFGKGDLQDFYVGDNHHEQCLETNGVFIHASGLELVSLDQLVAIALIRVCVNQLEAFSDRSIEVRRETKRSEPLAKLHGHSKVQSISIIVVTSMAKQGQVKNANATSKIGPLHQSPQKLWRRRDRMKEEWLGHASEGYADE